MIVQFKNVLPSPLADANLAEDTLWHSDFSIDESQTVLVQAISGKGKSTFVNSIYGIRKDFTGEILLDGQSTKEISMEKWSEIRGHKMSIIFQDLQLIPHLTVHENLTIKNDLTHHYSSEIQKEMVDKVGLSNKWDVACGNLSYGQQQRIAIVRALLQPFEIILLDEPFAHLDKENSKICYSLIKEEAIKNGATIVLTTLDKTDIDTFTQHLSL